MMMITWTKSSGISHGCLATDVTVTAAVRGGNVRVIWRLVLEKQMTW